jgi:hypothetical protein
MKTWMRLCLRDFGGEPLGKEFFSQPKNTWGILHYSQISNFWESIRINMLCSQFLIILFPTESRSALETAHFLTHLDRNLLPGR